MTRIAEFIACVTISKVSIKSQQSSDIYGLFATAEAVSQIKIFRLSAGASSLLVSDFGCDGLFWFILVRPKYANLSMHLH